MKNILFSSFLLIMALFSWGCDKAQDDKIKGFIINVPTITEGDSDNTVEITIMPDGNLTTEIRAKYELVEGTARFGTDIKPASGTLVFIPGPSAQTVTLTIIGDKHSELTEQCELILTWGNKTITNTIKIIDDDELEPIMSDADGFYTDKPHPSMEMVWNDEFDNARLDLNSWTYELGNGCDKGICGWGNKELQSYTDLEENVRLENGHLIITAINDNGYTSGRIKTEEKFDVRFGRIDVRAKLPEGQGIWPAIWMLGTNIKDVGWPACGEIDIMELIGSEPNVSHGTVHYDDNGYKSSTGSRTLTQGKFSDKFHVFSIVWDKDLIEWYVDNKKFKTFHATGTGGYPFNASFYFIINVALGGVWPGNPDETTIFPQQMTVDYIRVYQ